MTGERKLIGREYRFNKRFRDYVDKYCKVNKVSVEDALQHSFIKAVYLRYTDV